MAVRICSAALYVSHHQRYLMRVRRQHHINTPGSIAIEHRRRLGHALSVDLHLKDDLADPIRRYSLYRPGPLWPLRQAVRGIPIHALVIYTGKGHKALVLRLELEDQFTRRLYSNT